MKHKIIIDNILGGWAISDYITRPGEFLSSVGIDPNMPAKDNGNKPSGFIRPTSMAKFSGANVNATPMFFLVNPKNDKIYALLNNGKFISYTKTFGTETVIATLATCSGNGMAYNNNAIFIASNTDIAKYTRMDATPALDEDYWTNVLALATLTNTTYPSINGVAMPNHAMHYHADKKRLYVCDVVGNKGVLHFIATKKTTYEGDTDDGSTFNALDFDYGEYPTCIETYQTELVIGLIEGVDTTIKQRPAKIAFWDMSASSYSSITSIELSDPLITAIKNVNGVLYVFSGSANKGCRVSKLVSGYRLEEVAYLPEVYPPLPGAVDHILNRVLFGSNTVEPEVSGSAFAIGAKEKNFPMGLHNIARATATGANPMVTAVLYPTQTSGAIPPIMIGWKDDTPAYGIDKYSSTYGNNNVFRTDVYAVGTKFSINKVRMPLVQAVAANMTLKTKIFKDSASNTPSATDKTLVTINNTNYPNSERIINIYPEIVCDNDFFLQFEWEGTALLTVALPIIIDIDTQD